MYSMFTFCESMEIVSQCRILEQSSLWRRVRMMTGVEKIRIISIRRSYGFRRQELTCIGLDLAKISRMHPEHLLSFITEPVIKYI